MTPDAVLESKGLDELGIPGGINQNGMQIVQVEPGTFDPRQGLSDTRAMTKRVSVREAQAEIARFEMDQVLGHDTVPDCAEYAAEQVEPGSVFMMRWVDEAGFAEEPDARRLGPRELLSPRQLRDFARITVMDAILGNTDRHLGNFLVDTKNDRVWAIDSGFGQLLRVDGRSAIAYLAGNLPSIDRYDPEALRQGLSAAAAEVRAKLPELEEVARRRFGQDPLRGRQAHGETAANYLAEGLAKVEETVDDPVAWAYLRDRNW